MMKLFKSLFFSFIIFTSILTAQHVFAAGNIVPSSAADCTGGSNCSQFRDLDYDNDGTKDRINWSPVNGGATVTNTAITGNIFGESLGWINLNPNTAGVINSCSGVLSGYAWAHNGAWINFAPTNGGVTINTSTGEFSGYAWASGGVGGWIKFDCSAGANSCLKTTWRPDASCTTPIIGTGPGGGSLPTIQVIKHVVNVGGGNKTAGDFTLYIKNNANANISGSPFQGSETGISRQTSAGVYTISEDNLPNYVKTFSGDCDVNGQLVLPSSGTKICTVTNTYKANLQTIPGCTDGAALNYNPKATISNGSCTYPPKITVNGCTNSSALNYNPMATVDDGSCKYKPGANPDFICSDGLDNDNDGLFDYPADPGCIGPYDMSEDNPVIDPPIKTDPTVDPGIPGTPSTSIPIQVMGGIIDSAKPIAVVVGTLGLLSTIPGFATRIMNLIFAIPFYRKRRPWGIVFDGESKQSIDPAYVTVYNADTNEVVDAKITDINGRYGFLLPIGSYRMVAQKTHYLFPSEKLKGQQSDGVYDNLYFGEVFIVTDDNKNSVVVLNMPMDRLANDWNQDEKKRMGILDLFVRNTKLWENISLFLFILGFVFSIYALIVSPNVWNSIVFALYIFFTILQLVGFGPVSTGVITNKSGIPIASAVVRVWSAHLGTQIAQRVTNEKGQYYLLVTKGDYYITIDVKNASGDYDRVFTSETMNIKQGIINKSFQV